MGFLNNTTVTVDAILTKKGRKLLAQGTEAFNITKFALADDEIDYNLWDVTHPNGSDSYGNVIESMPLLEAIPDENHVMRYKLVTLPRTTSQMPIISASPASITFNPLISAGQNSVIVKATTNPELDSSYTFILHSDKVAHIVADVQSSAGQGGTTPFFLGLDDAPNSMTVVAMSVKLSLPGGNTTISNKASTQLTIVGNDTGATTSITIINEFTTPSQQNNQST